jgi:hypothetical protein
LNTNPNQGDNRTMNTSPFTMKAAEIGDLLVPKRGKASSPAVIRQLHRKDKQVQVQYYGVRKHQSLPVEQVRATFNVVKAADAPEDGLKALALAAEGAPAPAYASTPAEPRTHCKRGHELTDDNVIVWKSAGNARRCKACYDLKRAEQRARRKAKVAA